MRFRRLLSAPDKGRKTTRRDAQATINFLLEEYSKEECVQILKFMYKELHTLINKDIQAHKDGLELSERIKLLLTENKPLS